MSGNVVVRPLTAKLTRSTEYFGKMDPLVKVIIGTHVQRTAVARKGHKNPGWETELSLRRSYEDLIHLEVWDRDIIKGDLVGMGDISFNQIFLLGNRFNGWIPLRFKGRDVGELLVDVLFIPDAGVNTTEMLNQSINQQTSQQIIPIPISTQQLQTSQVPLQQLPLQQSQVNQNLDTSSSALYKSVPPGQVIQMTTQSLPAPTYLQTSNQMTRVTEEFSTPKGSYDKISSHPHCSVFHEVKTTEFKKEELEANREIENSLLPRMETLSLKERKPIFQSGLRGDQGGNPVLGTSGSENLGVQSS